MNEEEAHKRQIEAARATREYAPVMAQEVRTVSEHTPCIICGLADHQDQSLPIEALRHALAWHIIYEGVTPKFLVALKGLSEALTISTGPKIIREQAIQAAWELAREAIKEATLDVQKAANDETDS